MDEYSKQKATKVNSNILATYHHSFAGGSKNTSRILHYLADDSNCQIESFFFEEPQFFAYTPTKINRNILSSGQLISEVIDPCLTQAMLLENKIYRTAITTKDPILLAANLFPYAEMMVNVKRQMEAIDKRSANLIIHPVGSDIWQIGSQLKSRVKFLLESSLVDSIITYSDSFAEEIADFFDCRRPISIIPPVLESEHFFPLAETERIKRRKQHRFLPDDFIIHHHSSMRKIKCPQTVIEIASIAAQAIERNCYLIMSGPVPAELINDMKIRVDAVPEDEKFLYKSQVGDLTILWTGLVDDPSYFLQIGDVELNVSLHDSFNISLLEAMACGIPVISSDIVGIKPAIQEANAGICFPSTRLRLDTLQSVIESNASTKQYFDMDYAVQVLKKFAENSHQAQILGSNGAQFSKIYFGKEQILPQFKKHFVYDACVV